MDEHDRIMHLAWRVTQGGDPAGPMVVAAREELSKLLAMHAAKEEEALYRFLIASGDLEDDARAEFEREHRELLGSVGDRTFDRAASNALAAHIEAEELELFPSAMYAFDDEAWAAMDRVHHEMFHRFGMDHDHLHHG